MRDSTRFVTHIEESPVARSLFSDVRWAWLWLILRVYVGWQWLEAGWGKHSNPATVSINPVLFIIATWLVGA